MINTNTNTINFQKHKQMIFVFLLGGLFFSTVYYLSNTLKNPALAAIVGAFPVVIVCGYMIQTKQLFNMYIKNSLITMMITLVVLITIILIISKTTLTSTISHYIIITIALLIWSSLQFVKYKTIEKYNPNFQKL